MSRLKVTLIDVGWGDSILIEVIKHNNERTFALIDSNDSTNLRSTHIFLKRYFERERIELNSDCLFEFVMLSHAHSDHGQGLKGIIGQYGTRNLYYPNSFGGPIVPDLIRYARRYPQRINEHRVISCGSYINDIEDVKFKILWPESEVSDNENNNSIVLLITLKCINILLTGDIEVNKDVWDRIKNKIPDEVHFLKLPHHGSKNGSLDEQGETPLLDKVGSLCKLGISTHIVPYTHPSPEIMKILKEKRFDYFRTDYNHNVSFITNGEKISIEYSHQDMVDNVQYRSKFCRKVMIYFKKQVSRFLSYI
ncbi:ComEC/Rec2 family competence protein [Clostridium omnivorum]|uniref:MBL fold hydrolase n=1 Tax=Clostridium omnivorum TaxID=1604902 RepID=A0ABQ5N7C4_9CLOT|nr:hypothetical protein [Clostridium sp. E14]GLC31155.1 MBL fold hydrolase [Clostridium sp. E14]